VSFQGFPREALGFLRELAEHNDRDWFLAHRDDYESLLLEPARDFVEAMGAELETIRDDLNADPRVNGSIFRINRDTRFSRDKRPYKTHLDLWFWQGDGPSRGRPGFWFRLTADRLALGAGMHRFERDVLERYRTAVADDGAGGALSEAAARVESAGYELGGRTYKRVPQGYDPAHPRADLLRHEGLYAGVELPVPREAYTRAFPAFCVRRYAEVAPLVDWLATSI
jgi:uncharacterized protein (TIGR02453 family)